MTNDNEKTHANYDAVVADIRDHASHALRDYNASETKREGGDAHLIYALAQAGIVGVTGEGFDMTDRRYLSGRPQDEDRQYTTGVFNSIALHVFDLGEDEEMPAKVKQHIRRLKWIVAALIKTVASGGQAEDGTPVKLELADCFKIKAGRGMATKGMLHPVNAAALYEETGEDAGEGFFPIASSRLQSAGKEYMKQKHGITPYQQPQDTTAQKAALDSYPVVDLLRRVNTYLNATDRKAIAANVHIEHELQILTGQLLGMYATNAEGKVTAELAKKAYTIGNAALKEDENK